MVRHSDSSKLDLDCVVDEDLFNADLVNAVEVAHFDLIVSMSLSTSPTFAIADAFQSQADQKLSKMDNLSVCCQVF